MESLIGVTRRSEIMAKALLIWMGNLSDPSTVRYSSRIWQCKLFSLVMKCHRSYLVLRILSFVFVKKNWSKDFNEYNEAVVSRLPMVAGFAEKAYLNPFVLHLELLYLTSRLTWVWFLQTDIYISEQHALALICHVLYKNYSRSGRQHKKNVYWDSTEKEKK